MGKRAAYRVPICVIAGAAAWWSIAPVQATVFVIDEFTIIRNGGTFFQDTFGDGNAPPSIPVATLGDGTAATYFTQGVLGPETGGKLALDTALGVPVLSVNEAEFNRTLRARANSNGSNNPANLGLGLKIDDTFTVTGLFDLVVPGPHPERYAVRLGDVDGSDLIDLRVARREDGTLAIELRHLDNAVNMSFLVDEAVLDTNHDQILLRLSKDNAGTNVITGSFAYVDGVDVGAFTIFGNTTTAFNGEIFTRAEFRASSLVPEPSVAMLLGAGLLGWGASACRRRRSSAK